MSFYHNAVYPPARSALAPKAKVAVNKFPQLVSLGLQGPEETVGCVLRQGSTFYGQHICDSRDSSTDELVVPNIVVL